MSLCNRIVLYCCCVQGMQWLWKSDGSMQGARAERDMGGMATGTDREAGIGCFLPLCVEASQL